MDQSSHNSIMNANAGIIATSSDETIFVSCMGDVLVCGDFDCRDDRFGSESLATLSNVDRLHEKSNDCNLNESNDIRNLQNLSDIEDAAVRNLWRGGEQHLDEFSCCDVNASSYSKGLCGGAENNSNHYRFTDITMKKRSPQLQSSISDSSRSIKQDAKTTNDRGVAYVNSSDSSGLKPLAINTSRSINDEEYDNVDMNGVSLGDHDQWLRAGTNSPTPVMSFDYSSYEPPTPEASHSFDFEEGRRSITRNRTKNICVVNHISTPNLSEKSDTAQLTETIKLPPRPKVAPQKQSFRPHSLPSHKKCDNRREKQLPGIPTFLDHLFQIRITRVSAHPMGHHVLLVSNEGMLFSYGSNDRGQLGLGEQHTKFTVPQLITPLLESGGKTVNCAAGLDYSLVVVRTEDSRIAHRRNQHRRTRDSSTLNEQNAHQQMYAFGCNENNKLGLLDPDQSFEKSQSSGSPRWRWQKNRGDSNPIESIEPQSPVSMVSTLGSLEDQSIVGTRTMSNDVYLPRRCALHCRVIPNDNPPDTPTRYLEKTEMNIPYGIFSIAASLEHSAALVKRPSGAIELYTWGRGEDGKLGLLIPHHEQPSTPTRRWETLCCTSIDTDDETLNSLIDEGIVNNVPSNQSAIAPYFVATPTMVASLSMILPSEAAHPSLSKKKTFLHRSPRKQQRQNSPSSKKTIKSHLQESEYVVNIALGPSCSHIITSTGRWFVFGSSTGGLLSLGGHISYAPQPTEVNLPLAFGNEKMASISIGETHGLALTTTGRVFTWGTSPYGALGREDQTYVPIPQPILLHNHRRSGSLNALLSTHLRGGNSHSDTKARAKCSEDRSDDHNPVSHIHAGKDMSIFVLRSGSIRTCGRQSGRLGQGDVTECVTSPTEIFGGIQMWQNL